MFTFTDSLNFQGLFPYAARVPVLCSFIMHMEECKRKKKPGLLSQINRTFRKRIGRDDRKADNRSPKGSLSCPDIEDPIPAPSLKRERSRSLKSEPLDPTAGRGFLSLLDDDEMSTLETKMEGFRERNKRPETVATLPPIVSQMKMLMENFPECPLDLLFTLLRDKDGNCAAVYDALAEDHSSSGHHDRESFLDQPNLHFSTEYYHGEAPPKEYVEALFVEQDSGTFITFHRTDGANFHYFLCFKNILGSLTEKPIRGPVVPGALKQMLDLVGFLVPESPSLVGNSLSKWI